MNAGKVPESDETLRLIQRNEIFTKVGKILGNDFRILTEPPNNVLIQPAAFVLNRLWQFPMIHRQIRLDAIPAHFRHHIAV